MLDRTKPIYNDCRCYFESLVNYALGSCFHGIPPQTWLHRYLPLTFPFRYTNSTAMAAVGPSLETYLGLSIQKRKYGLIADLVTGAGISIGCKLSNNGSTDRRRGEFPGRQRPSGRESIHLILRGSRDRERQVMIVLKPGYISLRPSISCA